MRVLVSLLANDESNGNRFTEEEEEEEEEEGDKRGGDPGADHDKDSPSGAHIIV